MSNEDEVEEKFDHDNHDIRESWERMKEIMESVEPEMDKVLKDKGVRASVRARNAFSEIRDLSIFIRKGILLQRQDNKSGY